MKRQKHGSGTIVRISGRWYVRYWERRNIGGTIQQKRVSHCLCPVTTRGKPPADIKAAAEQYMATVNHSTISAERITTLSQFVETVYLPWINEHKRPSTSHGYRSIWTFHLESLVGKRWLKEVRTYDVQGWLEQLADSGLSRNTLKRVKSLLSAIFRLAKQQDFFEGENPVRDSAVSPKAPAPAETYAYTLEEVSAMLSALPEPASTAFAVAVFAGLRRGEIEGLRWEDYQNGEIHVRRSIWNGQQTDPKTSKSCAPVPVIRQLADRLDTYRFRCGNPESGPMFATSKGTPRSMNNLLRSVLPVMRKAGLEWRGWHACRRGLGSNLYRLGVPDVVIQRILRHANVNTTTAYYVKTVSDDVRSAMAKLENSIVDSNWTPTSDIGRVN